MIHCAHGIGAISRCSEERKSRIWIIVFRALAVDQSTLGSQQQRCVYFLFFVHAVFSCSFGAFVLWILVTAVDWLNLKTRAPLFIPIGQFVNIYIHLCSRAHRVVCSALTGAPLKLLCMWTQNNSSRPGWNRRHLLNARNLRLTGLPYQADLSSLSHIFQTHHLHMSIGNNNFSQAALSARFSSKI